MFRIDVWLGQFRAAEFGYKKIEMTDVSSNKSTVFKPKPKPAVDKKENKEADCGCFDYFRRKFI